MSSRARAKGETRDLLRRAPVVPGSPAPHRRRSAGMTRLIPDSVLAARRGLRRFPPSIARIYSTSIRAVRRGRIMVLQQGVSGRDVRAMAGTEASIARGKRNASNSNAPIRGGADPPRCSATLHAPKSHRNSHQIFGGRNAKTPNKSRRRCVEKRRDPGGEGGMFCDERLAHSIRAILRRSGFPLPPLRSKPFVQEANRY